MGHRMTTYVGKCLVFALLSCALAMPAQAVLCPANPSVLGVFFMDLRIGFSVSITEGAVNVLEGPVASPGCTDGSLMSLIEINIPDECTQANVLIEYEGDPSGWTVNLGDSITNNGFGGNAGETFKNAELQILDHELRVYNAADNPVDVDPLARQQLALEDGAIRLTVSNQTVGWGQPRGALETPDLERLFAIPDNTADGRKIYLGLNRVVSGPGDRTGCGARRVLVSFE